MHGFGRINLGVYLKYYLVVGDETFKLSPLSCLGYQPNWINLDLDVFDVTI